MEHGISALTALGFLLIVMKALGAIDLSWWIVLAPFWAPVALGLVIFAICGIIAFAL